MNPLSLLSPRRLLRSQKHDLRSNRVLSNAKISRGNKLKGKGNEQGGRQASQGLDHDGAEEAHRICDTALAANRQEPVVGTDTEREIEKQ